MKMLSYGRTFRRMHRRTSYRALISKGTISKTNWLFKKSSKKNLPPPLLLLLLRY
jgi:hypothetical protein